MNLFGRHFGPPRLVVLALMAVLLCHDTALGDKVIEPPFGTTTPGATPPGTATSNGTSTPFSTPTSGPSVTPTGSGTIVPSPSPSTSPTSVPSPSPSISPSPASSGTATASPSPSATPTPERKLKVMWESNQAWKNQGVLGAPNCRRDPNYSMPTIDIVLIATALERKKGGDWTLAEGALLQFQPSPSNWGDLSLGGQMYKNTNGRGQATVIVKSTSSQCDAGGFPVYVVVKWLTSDRSEVLVEEEAFAEIIYAKPVRNQTPRIAGSTPIPNSLAIEWADKTGRNLAQLISSGLSFWSSLQNSINGKQMFGFRSSPSPRHLVVSSYCDASDTAFARAGPMQQGQGLPLPMKLNLPHFDGNPKASSKACRSYAPPAIDVEGLDGRRHSRGVIAHEFGHNATLFHSKGSAELMFPAAVVYWLFGIESPQYGDLVEIEKLYPTK